VGPIVTVLQNVSVDFILLRFLLASTCLGTKNTHKTRLHFREQVRTSFRLTLSYLGILQLEAVAEEKVEYSYEAGVILFPRVLMQLFYRLRILVSGTIVANLSINLLHVLDSSFIPIWHRLLELAIFTAILNNVLTFADEFEDCLGLSASQTILHRYKIFHSTFLLFELVFVSSQIYENFVG